MLTDAFGHPLVKRTEAVFPQREMAMLAALSDTMQQLGICLTCIKCGGSIQGNNPPETDTFTLTCPCATRICQTVTGKIRVALH